LSTNEEAIQTVVLRNLICNEEYTRRVIPFIEPDYFTGPSKAVFKETCNHVAKYNKLPNKQQLMIDIDYKEDGDYGELNELVQTVFEDVAVPELDWLLDTTEKWCQDRALYNAVFQSIDIIDGKHQTLTKNALPEILSKALGVTFDTNVGHDYIDNVAERYEFYHQQEERIPFDLELFNKITKGGLTRKSLNICLAGTGVGKSLFMCHCAANALMQGRNVLYITLEMAEERIAERIDANLLNVPIDQLENMSKDMLTSKVGKLSEKSNGKLIIKEYPTSTANAAHFRGLLNELKLKKGFVPEIIFIDYINICASSRMKGMGGNVNSYTYIKAIAEELRGLAVEFSVPIMSATQTNRTGFTSSDPGLEDTAESFGLPATADLMFALLSNDELEQNGQLMVKQLKNRYADLSAYKRFLIGVDKSKMMLYDVKQEEVAVVDDVPVFDNTSAGRNSQQDFSRLKIDG
jgi:replicative DNA helicase